MTNDELFADLKQFIEAAVSQQAAHLDSRLDSAEQRMASIEQRIDTIETTMATKADMQLLDEKLDTIQDAIGDAFTHSDGTLQDHERRLQRLEHKAA